MRGQRTLLQHLGGAIEDYLRLQLNNGPCWHNTHQKEKSDIIPPQILLTKTPTVEGIDNYFDLFPDATLIVLVRDGRAVVESGVRSFDWDYEEAMQRWSTRAQSIIDFQDRHENSDQKFMLLRYEDMVTDEKNELPKVFNYLGVDPGLYDFERARSLDITGSSDTRIQTGEMHWHRVEKYPGFNPLERFSNWDRMKHERFNLIAGRQMSKLGYELKTVS